MEDNNLTEEDELPDYFVTAQNLNPYDRIKMQGVWQKNRCKYLIYNKSS